MKKCSHNSAFTLIELMIAIVVMSIAIPPIFWALTDANVRRVDPINLSKARWLAAEALEDIIADSHSTTRGYSYVTTANYPSESPVAGFTGYTRSVAVVESGIDLVAGSGTGFKKVTVSVTYITGRGTLQPLSVTTVVVDR